MADFEIPFTERWQRQIEVIDELLRTHLDELLVECPERLSSAIRYSILAPGKRLRPVLTLWAAEAVCGDGKIAVPAAIAVELIHGYSLIHDDIPGMDNDDLRRGRPTCHVQFDEATAILAGDALLPMAFSLLANRIPEPRVAVEACRRLAQASGPAALVGGQADDLRAEKEGGDAQLLASIHARKTGAMIRVSVELGGLLAGASPEQLEALSRFGRSVGQAFQIIDDLLDVRGEVEKMGKQVGKDHSRGKLTYPGIYGLVASEQMASDYTKEAVQAMESFGNRGLPLVRLAEYLLERTH